MRRPGLPALPSPERPAFPITVSSTRFAPPSPGIQLAPGNRQPAAGIIGGQEQQVLSEQHPPTLPSVSREPAGPGRTARCRDRRNLTTNVQLAAFALEHDAEMLSNDTDFARFPSLRWRNPLA